MKAPLLCRLGRHKPRATARWNNGFYFTRCARCGQDLVRTPFGRWHVPRGYRIVWQAEAPANAASAALVQERAAPAAAPARELPIQEVLRHVQNGAGPADGPAPAAAVAPRPAGRTMRATKIPDFMDEDAASGEWDVPARRPAVRTLAPEATAVAAEPRRTVVEPAPVETAKRRGRRATDRVGPGPAEAASGDGAPRAGARPATPAIVAAFTLGLLLFGLLFWPSGTGIGRSTDNNTMRGPQLTSDRGQGAFVNAAVLNCRAGPARDAQTVAVLARGDPVRLLARDDDWVSLAYHGGQCWALLRFFSIEPPIEGASG